MICLLPMFLNQVRVDYLNFYYFLNWLKGTNRASRDTHKKQYFVFDSLLDSKIPYVRICAFSKSLSPNLLRLNEFYMCLFAFKAEINFRSTAQKYPYTINFIQPQYGGQYRHTKCYQT